MSPAFHTVENFYRQVYWSAPTATTVCNDAYTLSYSGVTWLHSVNQLWLNAPVAKESVYLRLADRFFRRYDAEYSIVFTEPPNAGISDWLGLHGYSERASSPLLALAGLPQPRQISQTARVIRAGIGHQHDLLHILYSVFFIGPEVARCIVRPDQFANAATRHYLVYDDQEPVGCATLVLGNGMAGVWNVGIVRSHRRRGFAASLLLYALREAAEEGYTLSALIASPMGRPLYEEMGYRWIGNVLYYGLTPH